MRHGRLWLILIFWTVLVTSITGHAEEMSIEQRDKWLAQPELAEKVDELALLVTHDEVDSLDFALQGLAYPQQEAIRYLLLKRLDKTHVVLSVAMELFVVKQRLLAPTYQVVEKGAGYEFYYPAFDYPAIANHLVKSWKKDRNALELIVNIQQRQLDLKAWLTGESDVVEQHQALLVHVLLTQDKSPLTQQDVQYLATQVTKTGVVSWLPANQVMVALAKADHNEGLYKLLWLMRSDLYSEQEVARLGQLNDDFSVKQLMLASRNPRLKRQALSSLTKIYPMRDFVRQYLVEQMSQKDEARFVARALIAQGYRSWIEELVKNNRQVESKLLLSELAQ